MIELAIIEKSTLDGIGDAVREKKGTTALIPVMQLRPEILSISGEENPIIASTEQEVANLMIDENIGKFIRYEGEDGLYLNGAYYQVVLNDEADYTQYYILPSLSTPASAEDILLGKEAIDSNGNIITGTLIASDTGEILEPTPSLVYTLSDDETYYIVGTGFTSIEAIESSTTAGNAGSGLDNTWQGGALVIPSTYNDKPVKAIAPSAFTSVYDITTVYMCDGLTHIGNRAFQCPNNIFDTTMISCRLPNTLVFFGGTGGRIFWGRQGLTHITIPINQKDIKNSTFGYCFGLVGVNCSNVETLNNSCFQSCSSLQYIKADKVKVIEQAAFYNCSALTSIELPDIETIGDNALGSTCTSLTSVIIGPNCTSITGYALRCGSSTNKCTFRFLGDDPPAITTTTFLVDNTDKIIVNPGRGQVYKTATNWPYVESKIVEVDGETSSITTSQIEQMNISDFENLSVEEVER